MVTYKMNYFWLSPQDQRYNNYVFFSEEPRGSILRDMYKSLQCSCCKKIDEDVALRLPVSPDVKIKAKTDFVGTHDGVYCMSSRLRHLLLSSAVSGLDFLPLPGDSRYWIANPVCLVPTDRETAGFEL